MSNLQLSLKTKWFEMTKDHLLQTTVIIFLYKDTNNIDNSVISDSTKQDIKSDKETESIKIDSKILRKEIYQKHLNVVAAKPKTMEKYLTEMMKQGVQFIPTINKQGQLQGFRVRDMENQTEMKASEVHRNMGLKNLLNSELFFKEEKFNLNNTMQKLNEDNFQTIEKDYSNAEKKNNNFVSQNIFAPSPYIVDHTEDELKRKRKKLFKR